MIITQIKAERARIDALIEAASAPSIISFPASQVVLSAGAVYCGIMLEDGAPAYHLVLMPEVAEALTWAEGVEWAAGFEATMPTSDEWNLIMCNARGAIEDGYYWSSTEYDATNAWRSHSYSSYPGNQYNSNKSNAYMVRAVRKVAI